MKMKQLDPATLEAINKVDKKALKRGEKVYNFLSIAGMITLAVIILIGTYSFMM